MSEIEPLYVKIPDECAGLRADAALSTILNQYSRSKIQFFIKNGYITLQNRPLKTNEKFLGGETLTLQLPEDIIATDALAQNIPLTIIYEDAHILVLNKPAGLVVHPAAGNPDHTLLNALLHYHPDTQILPRAGIVHRLDKNTSGIMVVAKTEEAYHSLTAQLADRSMKRLYHAICCGVMISGLTIDEPIGRHGRDRKKMAVQPNGKSATTHVKILERFREHTYVECQLETGRTHQIRVHMNFIRFPLLGDETYGNRLRLAKQMSPETIATLRQFKRQALHAHQLTLQHPDHHKIMTFKAPLAEDFMHLLTTLRQDHQLHEMEDRHDLD